MCNVLFIRCCKLGYTELLTLLLNHGGEPDTLTNTGKCKGITFVMPLIALFSDFDILQNCTTRVYNMELTARLLTK